MKDCIRIKGAYKFEGFTDNVKIVEKVYDNVVVQYTFDYIFSYLRGTAADIDAIQLLYFETGDGTNSALKSDTSLQSGIYRQSVTSNTVTATQIICLNVLSPGVSNFHIREVGIFSQGSVAVGTGNLISRCNVDIDKNAATEYRVTYTMTIL